jgi:hypothetical protein
MLLTKSVAHRKIYRFNAIDLLEPPPPPSQEDLSVVSPTGNTKTQFRKKRMELKMFLI